MAAERQLRRVIDVFRRLGLEAILNLEKKDPQYVSVCNVVKRHGEEVGATLAMLNALISYRLAGKGEEHWQNFGRYFSQRKIVDVCKDFLTYLETSPYLRIGVETRKRRILKICRYRPNLENLINTLKEISELLNADPSQKTIVFSVKILNYAYMCSRGVERPVPFEIPIPVDFRVAHLTWCAGLVDMPPTEAMRRQREVQAVWSRVAQESGVPPLHIDTVLWLAGRAVLYGENVHNIPSYVIETLQWRGDCRRLSTRRGEISEG